MSKSPSLNGWAFPLAVGLSFLFLLGQIALFLGLVAVARASPDTPVRPEFLLVPVFFWAHAIFVILVAHAALPKAERYGSARSTLLASIPLAVIFFGIAALDGAGADYFCAEGQLHRQGRIPMWPWAWIGWAAVSLLALPLRFTAWLSKHPIKLAPLWHRPLMMLPFAAPVVLFGWPFQIRQIDCVGPQEGWGLFEGGMAAWPLLGVFLFAMSTTMAILTAAYVRPAQRAA